MKKNKLAAVFVQDALATKLYKESIAMRQTGLWRDAGDKLIKCAEMHTVLKMPIEAATIYTEAAECLDNIDKGEAVRVYGLSIKLYCDIGRFDIAGKLEKKVATVHYIDKHWEDAAIHFRKAANFLSGDKLLDQSDLCLEKTADCLIHLSELQEASKIYESVAGSCKNSNLRCFNCRDYLLKSIFCLMGVPVVSTEMMDTDKNRSVLKINHDSIHEKYGIIVAKCNDFDHIDLMWKCSKEKSLLKNLLVAHSQSNLHEFMDHLYWWNAVAPIDSLFLPLLRVSADEIKQQIAAAIAANMPTARTEKSVNSSGGSVSSHTTFSSLSKEAKKDKDGRSSVNFSKEANASNAKDNGSVAKRDSANLDGGGKRTSANMDGDKKSSVNLGSSVAGANGSTAKKESVNMSQDGSRMSINS